MTNPKECLRLLREASERIDELQEMVENPDPDQSDAGLAFLELIQDAQEALGRALHAAMYPMLSGRTAEDVEEARRVFTDPTHPRFGE